MSRTSFSIVAAFLLVFQTAYGAQANVPVDPNIKMIAFEPIDPVDLSDIPSPQIALWRTVHSGVLPLELPKPARVASASDLHKLLSLDGLALLLSEQKNRRMAAAARQKQLVKRGALVVGGGTFFLSFLFLAGVATWRAETAVDPVQQFATAPKRLIEFRRQTLQEALGHLLALRDCMVVATASNGEITACRLIKRPRLKFVSEQAQTSIAWMRSAHASGQNLEFASPKAQADFERFVYWARCLRDSDAAHLGLRELRKTARELDLAMREAAAPLPVVTLPVYKLPERARYESYGFAS